MRQCRARGDRRKIDACASKNCCHREEKKKGEKIARMPYSFEMHFPPVPVFLSSGPQTP